MPELLIGWARLLDGRFSDPRIGRDLLIGALAGTAAALANHVTSAATSSIATLGETSIPPDRDLLYGGIATVSGIIHIASGAVGGALLMFGLLFVLRLLLRGQRAAFIALGIALIPIMLGGESLRVELPSAIIISIMCAACAARGGLLATVSFNFFWVLLYRLPLPLGRGAPYSAASIACLVVALLLAISAFRRSLGDRLTLGRALADELS